MGQSLMSGIATSIPLLSRRARPDQRKLFRERLLISHLFESLPENHGAAWGSIPDSVK